MTVTLGPSTRMVSEAAGVLSPDATDATAVETSTDAAGNEWDSLGNLVQPGSTIGPDGNGGTTAIADDTQHHLSLAEQYAAARRDGFAVTKNGNAEQQRALELLRTV